MNRLKRLAHALRNRMRPGGVYVGDNTVLAATLHGDWIYLDGRDTSLTPAILMTGDWEPWIARTFRSVLRPGMKVVDVGCNCGFYTLIAARAVGASGRVVAIDANPRMVELTQRSIAANGMHGHARAVHGAVTDAPGPVEIGVPDAFMGSGSMLVRAGEHPMEVTTLQAPGDRLDAFLAGDLRVDVLKIDAEGAEPLILRGAESVLGASPNLTVFLEFAPAMQRHFEPPADFLARLRGHGFAIREVTPEGPQARSDADLLGRDWAELLLTR